jgi:hypothetical protein
MPMNAVLILSLAPLVCPLEVVAAKAAAPATLMKSLRSASILRLSFDDDVYEPVGNNDDFDDLLPL